MYDHPFQWGSKRTGPDLARVGGRYSDEWHVDHLKEPAVGGAGIGDAKVANVTADLTASLAVGVPYSEDMVANAEADLMAQADPNADTSGIEERYPKAKLGDFDGNPAVVTEMDALVSYLQMLGTLVDFSTYDEASGYR
jgi:cytochrome c oxidase cbb3-type subunit 2